MKRLPPIAQLDAPFDEEERGSLVLHPHLFTRAIERDEVTAIPFREQWMRDGVEIIHPLQPLVAPVGR